MGRVFYETRRHAMCSSAPTSLLSQGQMDKGKGGSLLSYLSFQGLSQLMEKWDAYKWRQTFSRRMSLFISSTGEHIGVAAYNRITILQKDDDYKNPCGMFIGKDKSRTFLHGAWSEPQGILGVIDDMNSLFFIKSNGQEIARTTARHLKVFTPIVDLIVLDELNAKKLCLCGFCIVTADGRLHHIDVIQDPSSGIYSLPLLDNPLGPGGQLSLNIVCLDYHPSLSLLILVDAAAGTSKCFQENSGFYSLSLWHITKEMECKFLFCAPQLAGVFSIQKGHTSPLASPKVIISPKGQYVAVLDLNGQLSIFQLACEPYSLSLMISSDKKLGSQMSYDEESGLRGLLKENIDVTWWSDNILVIAKRSGIVTMIDVCISTKVLENDVPFTSPVLERVAGSEGCMFILEGGPTKEMHSVSSQHKETAKMTDVNLVMNNSYADECCWSLISFLERSVSELYGILISKKLYQDALELATSHALDEDEVFKSQWLHSDQGILEINVFLSKIKDQVFALSECLNKGSTEDAVRALLSYGLLITDQYKFQELDGDRNDDGNSLPWNIWKARLQLLQCKDRLETFLGISMGRFSVQEYRKFLRAPLCSSAISLAESGKIGALNLLFKRHPYSLAPNVLEILSAVPETIPVESYSQLLPGKSPSINVAVRDADWVESERIILHIEDLSSSCEDFVDVKTEVTLKYCNGFVWSSVAELSEWYKNRARDIDKFTGLMDNCLYLVDFACRKGIVELKQFHEDIFYLHQLIYSSDEEINLSVSLFTWEQLSGYEKFKMMLTGTSAETVVMRLREKALLFMRNQSCGNKDSFLARWLKELAYVNKMDICLAVIEEACKDFHMDSLFKDEIEATEVTLDCVYQCTLLDQWNTLASMLSKLPWKNQKEKAPYADSGSSPTTGLLRSDNKNDHVVPSDRVFDVSISDKINLIAHNSGEHPDEPNIDKVESLKRRVKTAEGHVEVGSLLSYYQVPKPMSFFQGAHLDEKNVKQLLRLILSKFGRRQPGRSDYEWAEMWRDMQCFREKAFTTLDLEYMLIEFCRGLLKAGKFSLARNYLKGTNGVSLANEKAENLVIQAAREYFFSASSLSSNEIWKARECLNLFPNSDSIKAEADIIDALTVKLPNLGVTLLPVQFRQITNPMEIISMVITSQTRAYVDVDKLIEVARLLGLSSQDDTASIQEAVAREAADTGDLQVAFDLCLILSKRCHGPIWDLCAKIARGPVLENMGIDARKQLLGFALSHCDEESIGELLHTWKEIDMQNCCEKLRASVGKNFPESPFFNDISVSEHENGIVGGQSSLQEPAQEATFDEMKVILSTITNHMPIEYESNLFEILRDNGKLLSFAVMNLPWLIKLSQEMECSMKASGNKHLSAGKCYMPVRMQAILCILSWLSMNDIAPNDDLIASLANSVMKTSTSKEEDVLGCTFLLNLIDALCGAQLIEEVIKTREGYLELDNIMNVGVIYSSLHSAGILCSDPEQRRVLLLQKFQEKHAPFRSGELDHTEGAQDTFWREWKSKLEEQKQYANQARKIEEMVPGVDASRFLSGDTKYIEEVIFSFIDSVKVGKRHILKDAIKLADIYGLQRTEVLLHYLACSLVSEHWENGDILGEILDYKEDIIATSDGVINVIYSVVYPEIDGRNKKRLSYVYSILSACYRHLKQIGKPASMMPMYLEYPHTIDISQFCKLLEHECQRISFIRELNFKNIAGLVDLNFEHFNDEIQKHISESSVSALAEMVKNLLGIYSDAANTGLICCQFVYKYHVLNHLETLEIKQKNCIGLKDCQEFLSELQDKYESCSVYIRALPEEDILATLRSYCTLCLPHNLSDNQVVDELASRPCLFALLDFWIKVAADIQEFVGNIMSETEPSCFNRKRLSECLQDLRRIIISDQISIKQGWWAVSVYVKLSVTSGFMTDISSLYRAIACSGCYFNTFVELFFAQENTSSSNVEVVSQFYMNMVDSLLAKMNGDADEHKNLINVLSSLSKLQSNCRELVNIIRDGVWKRLIEFSENFHMPSDVRLLALEMMGVVSGKKVNNVPSQVASDVELWEGWEGSYNEAGGAPDLQDASDRVAINLVALKSVQLYSVISPSVKITSEDLKSLDSAVACFFRLSELAISESHLKTLQSILQEWEGLFADGSDAKRVEVLREKNEWISDDWDEGWETLPEELTVKESKQNSSASVNSFHTCWMEIIRKLIDLAQLEGVIELIDRSLSKDQGVLLSEDEAQCLFQLIVGINHSIGLKVALLLPYRSLWFQSLSILEEKLKQEYPCNMAAGDDDLLPIVISSGILSSIAADPSYEKVFSYLCCSVGRLSRRYQETVREHHKDGGRKAKENGAPLFGGVFFPLFVSELCRAGQPLLAGFMVSRWMHAHASLSLLNIAEVGLRRYLEAQLQTERRVESDLEELGPCKSLAHTVSDLRKKFGGSVRSALFAISYDTR